MKIRFQLSFVFFVVVREEKGKKNDNWNLWIWLFFVQKWPFRDSELFSTKWVAETSIFIVFLGARFFGQVVKKGKFWTPTKKRKNLTDPEKLFFLVCLCFFCFFLCFFSFVFLIFFFFFVFCFFGPPHLALNPPYFLFVFFVFFAFLLFFVLEGLRVR